MNNKKNKNKILFILFSFLVILIIGVFIYALYKTLSYDTTIYNVEKGSFIGEIEDTSLYLSILKDKEYINVETYIS